MNESMHFALRQRGRASFDFAAQILAAVSSFNRETGERLAAKGLDQDDALPDDLIERDEFLRKQLETDPSFQAANQCREWYCEHYTRIAVDAFEEIADSATPDIEALDEGPTTLDPGEDVELPAYWTDNEIHRTAGGWDGHPHMGFIHGELIHRRLVAGNRDDIYGQRKNFADYLAQDTFHRILEVGCSAAHFTLKLCEAFPDAEIHACDLSIRQLEQARRALNEAGCGVKLRRCSAADMPYPDAAFDLVTGYAILHELPQNVTAEMFRAAFRVLKPGGVLALADVPPYSRLSKLMQWRADFAARNEGEPFWRESSTLDVTQCLKQTGFSGIERFGMKEGPYPFPFVTRARKP